MTDSTTEASSAALVVRWLCHDLASPVATLLTASELLGDQPDPEINELITAAIRRLSARLRLVRLAMGTTSPMGTNALEKLIHEGLPDTPMTLSLPAEAPPASVIVGAALILSDINRAAPQRIDPAGARWTNDHPLPAAVAEALSGSQASDGRSAMIALVAAQAVIGGWRLKPDTSGVAFVRL